MPNTNSHSSGCTERVKRSRWSWRSLRSSAWRHREGAGEQAQRRRAGQRPGRRAGQPRRRATRRWQRGHRCQPPLASSSSRPVTAANTSSRSCDAVALQQLGRLALLDQAAVVHDRQPVAVALGLLHQVRGHDDRRAGLARAARAGAPTPAARAVGSNPTVGSSRNSTRGSVEQRGGDLQPPQHAARERARQPVEHRLELHRLDRRGDARARSRRGHAGDAARRSRGSRARSARRRPTAPAGRSRSRAHRQRLARARRSRRRRARPSVGGSSVVSTRSVVVLPAPLGPSRPNTSPGATAKDTPADGVHLAEADHEAVDEGGGHGARRGSVEVALAGAHAPPPGHAARPRAWRSRRGGGATSPSWRSMWPSASARISRWRSRVVARSATRARRAARASSAASSSFSSSSETPSSCFRRRSSRSRVDVLAV